MTKLIKFFLGLSKAVLELFWTTFIYLKHRSILALGWFLLIFGIITAPIPLPIGQFIALIGLSILVSKSPRIQKGCQTLRRKIPMLCTGLKKLGYLRYCPQFIKKVIEDTDPRHLL